MLKYVFFVYHRFYDEFLGDLEKMGAVHIEPVRDACLTQDIAALQDEEARLTQTLTQLLPYTDAAIPATDIPPATVIAETPTLLRQLPERDNELKALRQMLAEKQQWGDFSGVRIRELAEQGISLHFYDVPAKKFNAEWLHDVPAEIIEQTARSVKFVTVGAPVCGLSEVQPPEKQIADIQDTIMQGEHTVDAIRTRLRQFAAASDVLKSRLLDVRNMLQWLDIRANRTDEFGDGTVQILQGWTPRTSAKQLTDYLAAHSILVYGQPIAPDEGEIPPVKLRNNRFSRLFEPIGALYSLPNYRELDLTAFFAPFFALFFGCCLGDAGYGLLILLCATIAKFFTAQSLRPYLTLGQWLGGATVVMGSIFGTFFGVPLVTVPAFAQVKDMFLDSNRIFTMALLLGVIQVVFAIILRVINQFIQGTTLWLGSLGWLLLFAVAGVFEYFCKELAAVPPYSFIRTAGYIIAGALILFFSAEWKRKMLTNAAGRLHVGRIALASLQHVGAGLWDVYSNVTGLVGDILSYVRLFALGLAGSILGLVVNNMAVEFGRMPYIGPVVFVLLLLFGHAMNFALSSLGAFVHPMRLTFVEFYKNAGFSGESRVFTPFRKISEV
jgi:V/A-type H+-transporting ATPase subunit I